MVFKSRIVPVFMSWLPKISGSSIVSLPVKNRHFLYNASIIWNLNINKIGVPSIHEISPCVFKAKLKRLMLANQFSGNKENWTDNNIKYQLFTCDSHKTKPSN